MDSNKKTIFTSVIFVIIVFALIYIVIYPLISDIRKNSTALIAQKKELVLLQDKIKNLKKFEKTYQTYQQNLERINLLFINPEIPTDIIKFVGFLKKTAEDFQILINISPPSLRSKITTDPWPSIEFQINLTGSFQNCLKFLEKIETAPYLIEIQSLSVNRLTEAELRSKELERFSLGDIRATFPIKVYSR